MTAKMAFQEFDIIVLGAGEAALSIAPTMLPNV
jgi:hypothetical protein